MTGELYDKIPEQLKEEALFCLSKDKIPQSKNHTNGDATNRNNFGSYKEIMQIRKEDEEIAIGLFDSFCGIDIDDCYDDKGEITQIAYDIMTTLQTYTEKSPSGKGLHILFKCPDQKDTGDEYYQKRSKGIEGANSLEAYMGRKGNKCLRMSGNVILTEVKTISFVDLQRLFLDKYMKKPEMTKIERTVSDVGTYEDDEHFLQIGLEQDRELQAMWNAIPSGSGGTESEDDLKLMNKLAYWTNCNETLMAQAFEDSPYFKAKDNYHIKKWHRLQNSEIRKAIRGCRTTARERNIEFIERQNEKKQMKEGTVSVVKQEEPQKKYQSIVHSIDSFFEKVDKETFKPMPTLFTNLDKALNGGFIPQSLITLNGATGIGKTTFALNLARKICERRPVLYLTLEMSEELINARIFSKYLADKKVGRISATHLLQSYEDADGSGRIFARDNRKKIVETLKNAKELEDFFVVYPKEITVTHIKELIEKYCDYFVKQGKETPFIVVDYLQYIQSEENLEATNLVKKVIKMLKDITIERNTTILVLSANSRTANKQKKSSLDSGRDSSDIEYTGDYVLGINFTDLEEDRKTKRSELSKDELSCHTLIIHKQRMGQSNIKVEFKMDGEISSYEETDGFTEIEPSKANIF